MRFFVREEQMLWARFAAAAVARGETIERSALVADGLLEELRSRLPRSGGRVTWSGAEERDRYVSSAAPAAKETIT